MEKWILLAQQAQQTPSSTTGIASAKDFIPLIGTIVGAFLTAVFGIIITLLWKWKDAEIKRLELKQELETNHLRSKNASEIELLTIKQENELKLLKQERETALSRKENEIANLQAEIKNSDKAHTIFRQMTTIAPLEFVKDIRPILEERIKSLQAELQNSEQANNQLRLELEDKIKNFEEKLNRLSKFEEFIVERANASQAAATWITINRDQIGRKACRLAAQADFLSKNLEGSIAVSGR